MSVKWQERKAWADKFMPDVRAILGGALIGVPTREDDRKCVTDLVFLVFMVGQGTRVACRIRRSTPAARRDEFTLRAKLPSGAQTELHKVGAGWGDLFFYGFAAHDEASIGRWTLLRLDVFRAWRRRNLEHWGCEPGQYHSNDDGTAFYAYNIAHLPDDFVHSRGVGVARGQQLMTQRAQTPELF